MLLKDSPASQTPFSFKTFLPLIFFFCIIIAVTFYIGSMRKKGEVELNNSSFLPDVKLSLESDPLSPALPGKTFLKGVQPENLPAIPNAEQSYLLAGRAMENGNLLLAEELLRNALIFHPGEIKLYTLLSAALFQQKKLPEAEGVLRRLLFHEPSNLTVCRNLATVLRQQKKYSEAIPVLTQVLRNLPPGENRQLQGEIHLQQALMYAGTRSYEESLKSLRKAGELLEGRQILDAVMDPLFDDLRNKPEFHQVFKELSGRRKK